jgi:death-on-curing protein
VIFLDLEELLHVAERTIGPDVAVRDIGLLESALARPKATAFGSDAYSTIHDKAAALLHSLSRNHGNKRLALAGTIAFYGMNGLRLTLNNDEAYTIGNGRRARPTRRCQRDRWRLSGLNRRSIGRGKS